MITNEIANIINILALTGVGDVAAVLEELMFFGPPIGITIWFIVSLISFLATPKEHEKRAKRKKLLTISGVIFGAMALVLVGFIAFLAVVIANM